MRNLLEFPEVQGKIRVIVADDHRVFRYCLKQLLQSTGVEVVGECDDGAKAVELASRLRPDLIIMDVNMPITNGIDATRRIVHDCPGVQVIGFSMHDDAVMAQRMIEAGAAACLTKSGPVDDLLEAIHALQAA